MKNATGTTETAGGKDPVRILIDAADVAGEAIGVEFAKATREQIREYLQGEGLLDLDPDDQGAKDIIMDAMAEFAFNNATLGDKVEEVIEDVRPALHGACLGPVVGAALDLIRETQGLALEVERTRDLGPVIRPR